MSFRMHRGLIVAAALGLLAGVGGRAQAAMITYTFEETASGTLGGVAFTDAAVRFVATADTAGITTSTGPVGEVLLANPITAATVTISGFGEATILDSLAARDNDIGYVALASSSGNGNLSSVSAPEFRSYDLATSIGPVTGGSPQSATRVTYHTSLGDLVFSNRPETTFTATVQAVPEPTSLAMLGIGAVGMLGYGWRRRSARRV